MVPDISRRGFFEALIGAFAAYQVARGIAAEANPVIPGWADVHSWSFFHDVIVGQPECVLMQGTVSADQDFFLAKCRIAVAEDTLLNDLRAFLANYTIRLELNRKTYLKLPAACVMSSLGISGSAPAPSPIQPPILVPANTHMKLTAFGKPGNPVRVWSEFSGLMRYKS